MNGFNSKILQMAGNIKRSVNNTNEYLLIAKFGKSSVATEDETAAPFFRIFTPVKPEKNRKLNAVYGAPFDIINDSLLDYPTIIRYKLGKTDLDWDKYNRLISVHISECPLNCWHCYLQECVKNSCEYCDRSDCDQTRKNALEIERGWFSAKKIVDAFIEQRDIDASHGIASNVLRVTGGEPLLIPDFLIEILNEIKQQGLVNEIFVWTETNLTPLTAKKDDFYLITDETLSKLAEFNNFCIHPCFHGLNESEFQQITGYSIDNFDILFDALQRLIDNGIDVYPTFGSNVSHKNSIELFFKRILDIDSLLPLRFALIEYTDYPAITERKKIISSTGLPQPTVFDKKESIEIWDSLLIGKFRRKYTELPRHLIPYSKKEDLIHLFKWPSKIEFQRKLLEIISLPYGSRCRIQYDEIWINDYFEVKYLCNNSRIENTDAFFWILSCCQTQDETGIITNFVFAYPFRRIKIKNIQKVNNTNYFEVVLLDYIENPRKMGLSELKSFTKIPFNDGYVPYPGVTKGFVFLGIPQQFADFSLSKDVNLKDLYAILSEIDSLNSVNVKIFDYPLVKIENIVNTPTFWDKIGRQLETSFDQGEFVLKKGKEYRINYNFYQGEDEKKRTRQISINSQNFIAKSGRGSIFFTPKYNRPYFIEVLAGDVKYSIELPIKVEKLWYKENIWQFVILVISSIILILIGFFVFHLKEESFIATVIPIIVVFIGKILKLDE